MEDDQIQVEALEKLEGSTKFDIWKHFEDRAGQLSEALWSTGTWLMALVGATLAVPFLADFVALAGKGFPIKVESRLPVIAVAAFGIALCLYSYVVLCDIREHIQRNWQRAGYALGERNPKG